MRRGRNALRMGWMGAGLALALAVTSGMSGSSRWLSWFSPKPARHYATTPVRRSDLNIKMTTGGRVDSSEKTMIECALEAGIGMPAGGASTILSLVPEGTMVKKGDVLCSLDASPYEEIVRVQEMNVDRVRADFTQAELNLEVAKIAVTEYRDGLMQQSLKEMRGQIALTRSNQERTGDRLRWAQRMLLKGYLPPSQVSTEEFNVAQNSYTLKKSETALRMFEEWSAPKYLRILNGDVLGAQAVHEYQSSRLSRSEERLRFYKKQVAACTITAPHDGFLIYCFNPERPNVQIEAGTVVRQRQKLFYLPDLGRMEVAAMLHESVVKEVQPGMRAKVEVEGLPDRLIEGHVDSVAQTPTLSFFSDVRYFVGIIKLDNVPAGLKPGMTASVELMTVHKPDVLVIPTEALTVEQGRDVCYVALEDGLKRREVTVGQATRDLIEVTGGLEEGESVVLDPTQSSDEVVHVAEPEHAKPVGVAH